MRSEIHAAEVVGNEARRFGESTIYYPALLIRTDEPPVPLLFTPDDLAVAKERASRQPEDIAAKQAAYRAERRIMRMTWAALAVALSLASALVGGLLL